jgi:hypothetical protein
MHAIWSGKSKVSRFAGESYGAGAEPGVSFHLRKSPMEKERLRQLTRIGVNLNQIARWANTYKRAVEAIEVLTALSSLEREIRAFLAAEIAGGESCT